MVVVLLLHAIHPNSNRKAFGMQLNPGTYTNYGGVVVKFKQFSNNIKRSCWCFQYQSELPLDLSSYTTIQQASRALVYDKSVSVLTNAVNIINNLTFTNGLLRPGIKMKIHFQHQLQMENYQLIKQALIQNLSIY